MTYFVEFVIVKMEGWIGGIIQHLRALIPFANVKGHAKKSRIASPFFDF